MQLGEFDVAITSPPYLNAIDYLRGHRMSLIWLGFEVDELRSIRSNEIGAERASKSAPFSLSKHVALESGQSLPGRYRGWVNRYASDMYHTIGSLRKLVRARGQIVIVVGNSLLRGASIDNAGIIEDCALRFGLRLAGRTTREIPARRRYLPTPARGNPLAKRMREETVLTFEVPA
jgi:hypothetical protein